MKPSAVRVLGLSLLLVLCAFPASRGGYSAAASELSISCGPSWARPSALSRRPPAHAVQLAVSVEWESLDVSEDTVAAVGSHPLGDALAEPGGTVTTTVYLPYVGRTDYQWGFAAHLGPLGRRLWRFGGRYVAYFAGDVTFAGCYAVLVLATAALLVNRWIVSRESRHGHRLPTED